MLPFATPLSHAGNERVGAFLYGPEVGQQAVEIVRCGDALLRGKALQISSALKEDGSLLSSFLCPHIVIEHLNVPDLEAQNLTLGFRGLSHHSNVAGHGGEDGRFLRLIERAGNGLPNRRMDTAANPRLFKITGQEAPLNCAAALNRLLDTAHDARMSLSCVVGYPMCRASATLEGDRLNPMVEQLAPLTQRQQYALIIASRHGWLLAAHHFNGLDNRGKRLFTEVLSNTVKHLGLALTWLIADHSKSSILDLDEVQ